MRFRESFTTRMDFLLIRLESFRDITVLASFLCELFFLCCWCFDDWQWFLIMLSFSDSSSRQAAQNNFPADTVIISFENSLALCAALTPIGLVEQAGLLCRIRVCRGSLALTFRLRIRFDWVGALSWLSSVGGPVDDAGGPVDDTGALAMQSSLLAPLLLSSESVLGVVAMMIRAREAPRGVKLVWWRNFHLTITYAQCFCIHCSNQCQLIVYLLF